MTRPVGRPEEYKPEYCQIVIDLMYEGCSIMQLARHLKIGKQTLYEWKERHPEFADAIKRGTDFSQGWWEENGHKTLYNKDFNHVLWMMNMRNRFRADWSEKQENKENATADIDEDRELAHRCQK